jgi:nitroimidazol reductase NimA-like FMN-containing flavoprotein (pyridoxamine 5'-phosphate oxidase superfamily)
MTLETPVADLDSRFSSPDATALPWMDAEQQLQKAGVFWLSTVRPEGRPHVAPLIAVWLDGALYFCTGEHERKAKNLAKNTQVAVTTGCNALTKGLDIMVEGEAVVVSDDAKLRRVADAYVAKYGEGWRFAVHDGAFYPDTGSVREENADRILVFEVTPTTAFGFGRSEFVNPPWRWRHPELFSQTRWRFQASRAAARSR